MFQKQLITDLIVTIAFISTAMLLFLLKNSQEKKGKISNMYFNFLRPLHDISLFSDFFPLAPFLFTLLTKKLLTKSKKSKQKLVEVKTKMDKYLNNQAVDGCPLCGDEMIDSISRPFITSEEHREIDSWRI